MELLVLVVGTDRLNGLAPARVERACTPTRRGQEHPQPPDRSKKVSHFQH